MLTTSPNSRRSTGAGPLVSVVTPVYNCGAYVRECIESVLAQTHTNWDYTIVDNCSTDDTAAIVSEYQARDTRIKLKRNETFVRVNENYNNAFREISPDSQYCKVLAGDDRMYPECLEKMVALAAQNPTVAIVGSYTLNGMEVVRAGLPADISVFRGPDLCRSWLLRTIGHPFVTPSTVLYRSDLVRAKGAFFNEASLAADQEVVLEILADHDFGFVHQILTYLRPRDESMTSFSSRMNTYLSANLYELEIYGPKHLNEKEMRERTKDCLHNYYRYLAKQLYNSRDAVFWRYHRDRLASLKYPLNHLKLLAFGVLEGVSFLFEPRRILRRMTTRRPSA